MLNFQRRREDPEYSSLPVVFEDVGMASYRIREHIKKTECLYSAALSNQTGCTLYFKHDHRQHTGSFKERGAINALLLLNEEQRKKGVIAASAGNHALALSYHGSRLNIPVTVVMPLVAPITKISKCKEFGATVHLHGSNIADCKDFAMTLVEKHNYTYINGYDDPAIIAGAGTMGLEIMEQVPDVDAVLIPIGGAGLIAGVSMALKMLNPNVMVIGVEPVSCPSFTRAIQEGKPVKAECFPTLADGLAVPTVGSNAFQIARKFVDKVVTVRERYIALSVLRMLEVEKTVVEGGGVVGLAPLLADKLPELKGKKVVVALCGGNIDITALGRVIDRGLAADGRLIQFEVSISDRPGGLAAFTKVIAETGASVKDLFHERAFIDSDLMTIMVRCVVETRDAKHAQDLFNHLTAAGHKINLQTSSLHVLTQKQQQVLERQQQEQLRLQQQQQNGTVMTVEAEGSSSVPDSLDVAKSPRVTATPTKTPNTSSDELAVPALPADASLSPPLSKA